MILLQRAVIITVITSYKVPNSMDPPPIPNAQPKLPLIFDSLYRNGSYEKSGNDYWQTPKYILDSLVEEFGELFDPCPALYEFDGLSISWHREKVCFVNPPYSKMSLWIEKAYEEWKLGSTIILLIPPRTDTKYFHDYINNNAEIRFIKGRIKFIHPDTGEGKSAPFPSIFCIFRGENNE